MIVLRPIKANDLDQVYTLAAQTKVGLTSLPLDRAFLENRITDSERTFSNPPQSPNGDLFMFVLEDLETGTVVGTSALFTKVGGFKPNWTYEIKSQHNESDVLGVKKEIPYLQLKKDHDGPSEIGTLFLSEDYRRGFNGRTLSLGRFLFMAQNLKCFESHTIAEMRGVINEDGVSVFWRSLGKHFFDVSLAKADLMVNKDKSFIADLMPKHPIYIPLLPEAAQAVIARTHADTKPARRLLESEGFRFNNEIDIFEAGPVLSAETKRIRTVKESQRFKAEVADFEGDETVYLLSNHGKLSDFRATNGEVKINDDKSAIVRPKTADALKIKTGDSILLSPIKAK